MGNVKSFCCKDSASDSEDREERSRILSNENISSNDIYNNSTASNVSQDNISYGSINNGNNNKTMEQSALDRIYQKMAANVIDVAPGDSMVIQPAEFMERQRAYQAKLNQIRTPLPFGDRLNPTNNITSSPQHVAKEKRGVEYEPIPAEEVQLINEVSLKSVHAIKGLKIKSQDRVVTQFKP